MFCFFRLSISPYRPHPNSHRKQDQSEQESINKDQERKRRALQEAKQALLAARAVLVQLEKEQYDMLQGSLYLMQLLT